MATALEPDAGPDLSADPLALAAIGAAEVCALVEAAVREYLPAYLPPDLPRPHTWEQLPTGDAMFSADTPAVAFTTPGLTTEPERKNRGNAYDATWSVVVSVWVRGEDGTFSGTTNACRRYVKAVRTAVLAYAHHHGQNWAWTSEQYDALPQPEVAATLQAGLVAFDVPVIGAVDLQALQPPPIDASGPDGALPLVQHTHVTTASRRELENP